MSTIIALDIGTSKLCALAFCAETHEVRAVAAMPNDADVPGLRQGRHEQDPVRLRDRCVELLERLVSDSAVRPENVAGIGFSGQMHGVVLVDGNLEPLTNLITWRDGRVLNTGTAGSLREALSRLEPSAPRRAGCELNAGYGAATLFWLVRNDQLPPGSLALTIAGYVAACLCGKGCIEPTHAASWGIFDVEQSQWDADSVERLGIPAAVLPAVRPSAGPVGVLLPETAGELGLPDGVRIAAPVGDNQASVIGAAGFKGDACVINLGTGGQVSIPTREYEYRAHLETRPMPFGGYIVVGASLCGGWSYAYLCRFFRDVVREIGGVEISEAEAYARMNDLAASAPPGSGGILADTRFSGTRGDPDIRGGFVGIDRENLTVGNLSRAVVVGMVRELAEMARNAGIAHVSRIVAGGNAVRKNPIVKEVIEAEFGVPCRVGQAKEEAALGAAYCTAVGLGLLKVDGVEFR